MDKHEFGLIVTTIRSAYRKNDFLSSIKDKELWYTMLKDMEYVEVSRNLCEHIKTNKYMPSISELRGKIPGNDFNNFQRRRYDMDQLERRLLESSYAGIEG